eukprot:scaffold2518_cov178-Amphora_coffeaeformis.AAC.16
MTKKTQNEGGGDAKIRIPTDGDDGKVWWVMTLTMREESRSMLMMMPKILEYRVGNDYKSESDGFEAVRGGTNKSTLFLQVNAHKDLF